MAPSPPPAARRAPDPETGLGLSPRTQRRLFGAPPTIDGQTLASDTHALIKLAELAESTSFLNGMSVAEGASARPARGAGDRRPAADPDGAGRGTEIPGQGGIDPGPPLRPRGLPPGAPMPLTIFFHGGGWQRAPKRV